MIYEIDGVTLDLKIADGMLTVGRDDGSLVGAVRVADPDPDPDPAEVIASPEDAAPGESVVPRGWQVVDGGDVVDETGKSIFSTTPTEG